MKKFYRVGNTETQQGLWYDFNGNFTGLIHNEFKFCSNCELPMPFDEDAVGWLSSVDVLEDLFFWFTKEDIKRLEEHGFRIAEYEATEYRAYENHWMIKQDSSVLVRHINVEDVEQEVLVK